jgi:hypothetical protein
LRRDVSWRSTHPSWPFIRIPGVSLAINEDC